MIQDIFLKGNGGWLGAAARLGVPIVLTLVFTWFLLTRIDTTQAAILVNQNTIMNGIQSAQIKMSGFAETQTGREQAIQGLLLQTCINTARTESASQACLEKVR